MKYNIVTIKDYPDNGSHQQCYTDMPFCIRKGEDGYYYKVDGVEKKYNIYKGGVIDKRWICNLKEDFSNESLDKIFKIKCHKDLDVILEYCRKLYVKSLRMELVRITKQIEDIVNQN